jgi:hypothetical protein
MSTAGAASDHSRCGECPRCLLTHCPSCDPDGRMCGCTTADLTAWRAQRTARGGSTTESRQHVTDGGPCWCDPVIERVPGPDLPCSCPADLPEDQYAAGCQRHEQAVRLMSGPQPALVPVLDLATVQDILARRAYRPGWTLTAYVGDTTRAIIVQITAEVEDSYNPGSTVPLDIRYPVPAPALASELDLDKWLAWRLGMIELHESAEWYRKPGRNFPFVPVFNPHADGADRDQWPIVKREPA